MKFVAGILLTVVCLRAGAQTNAVVLAGDGAYTWYNDPRAIFHNGILFAGFVRNADGRSTLSAYDPATGTTTSLWTSSWAEADDHDNPALLPLADGRLIAFNARHSANKTFAWHTSLTTNPVTSADWGAENMYTSTATVAYQNPYHLTGEGGKIYDFMRSVNYNPTFVTSTDSGTNWSVPTILVKTGTGSIRPYVKYWSDFTNRIDFLYTDGHPRDVTNSLYHAFYSSNAVWMTDGTFLKSWTNLPLLHDSSERGSIVYQYSDAPASDPDDHIPTGRAWCWETACNSNGWPYCVFTVQRDAVMGTNWYDARIYYYYAWWTPADGWQKRFVAQAGRQLYTPEDDYAGGIALDPDHPDIIYISSNAQNPFDLSSTTNVPLSATRRYEIFRGVTTHGGMNFSWSAITTNSSVDNLRPHVPRFRGTNECLIWFRGTYSAYTSFATQPVALFGPPQFAPTNSSPTLTNDPSEAVADWHGGRNVTAPSLDLADTDSPRFGKTATSTDAQLWGYFAPLAIQPGQTIRLKFSITMDQTLSSTVDQLRFGLFYENSEARETNRVFTTYGSTNTDNWRGVYVTADNSTTASASLRECLGGTPTFMTANASFSVGLGTWNETPLVTPVAGAGYPMQIDFRKNSTSNFTITGVCLNGSFAFSNMTTHFDYQSFGAVGFLNGGGTGVSGLSLSNVAISLVGAPPYDFWSALHGLPYGNEMNDPDGDGYASLLEYVTGGNPTNADTIARMNSTKTNGFFALKFNHDTTATDITLVVEGAYTSTNNAMWNGIATNIHGSWGGTTNYGEDTNSTPAVDVVWDTDTTATNRFLRLRVTRP